MIIWRDECSVGVKALDQQHQKIFQLINNLIKHHNTNNVDSEIISEALNEMVKYVQEHLDYEEKLLKENNYPDFSEHVSSHIKYIEQVTRFSLNIMNGDGNVPDELLQFLTNWWEQHILIEDQKYRSYLE
jgi:hemerythrin